MKTLLPLLLLSSGIASAVLPDGFSYSNTVLTFKDTQLFNAAGHYGIVRQERVLAEGDFDGNGTPDYVLTYDPFPGGVWEGDRYFDALYGKMLVILTFEDSAQIVFSDGIAPEDVPYEGVAVYDADSDGLLDPVLRHGYKVFYVSDSPDFTYGFGPFELLPGIDQDGDGINDLDEVPLRTSVVSADTDHDTLPDGWELERGRDPLVADLGYYDELRARAFPAGEPSIEISRDRSVSVTGLYPAEGLTIVVQVSEDLETWRDGASAEDAVSGVLRFQSPLPGGFVRVSVREE